MASIHRTALDMLVDMERAGFSFRDGGDILLVSPKDKVSPEQAAVLREGRDGILEVLRWRRLDAATDAKVQQQSDAGVFDAGIEGAKRK